MEIEEEIAATLRDTAQNGVLPDTFAERVVGQLPSRQRPHTKWRAGIFGIVATAATIVVLVAFVAPMVYHPADRTGSNTVLQFKSSGLALDYPSAWHVTYSGLALHYEQVIAFMGTGDGSLTCGSDYIPGLGGTCAEKYALPANSVVVKVSVWDGPPTPKGAVDWASSGDPLASPAVVGGYPAVVRTLSSGSTEDLVLEWTLTEPGNADGSYRLTAHFKGPDIAPLRSQVDALIESVSFGT
jgi:hypothetical protein